MGTIMAEKTNINPRNPRGAGRKPKAAHEKSNTINVILPQFMFDYVKESVSQQGYSSIAEYIRELVRKDMLEAKK